MEINSFIFLQLQNSLSSSKRTCEITGRGVILNKQRLHKKSTPLVTEKDGCLQQKIHVFFFFFFLQYENGTTAKSQLRKSASNSLQVHVEI